MKFPLLLAQGVEGIGRGQVDHVNAGAQVPGQAAQEGHVIDRAATPAVPEASTSAQRRVFHSKVDTIRPTYGFEDVAAYLAMLDISDFNPKAPPPKTPAFWAIVDANRPPEESEIADVLDLIGNPPALTIERLAASAEADLSAFLRDKTKRKAAKHRIEAAGYEIVRNDVAQDGLWVVNVDGVKARKTIYARNELSLKERMKAAHRVADGDTWHRTDGVWDWVPRPR